MTAKRVEIRIARGATRKWHETLWKKLNSGGHTVWFKWDEAAYVAPPGLQLLTIIETMIYAGARSCAGDVWKLTETGDANKTVADLIIDLTNANPAPAKVACLSPLWNDCASEIGAIAALLDRHAPRLTVVLHRAGDTDGSICTQGVPALEKPENYTHSFDSVCGRMCDLVMQAVRGLDRGAHSGDTGSAMNAPSIASMASISFAMTTLARKIAARLTGISKQGSQWRLGWRHASNDLVIDTMRWPAHPYNVVRDDGQRYFADPFVFRHSGMTHVFCEEFPYSTRRGIISAFTISDDGVVSAPRPVLECPWHLSYPMIFAHGDAIFMIPETSANRTIELWRAERFPDRWIQEAILVDNVVASDATLIAHGGRYWIFATIAEDGQSTWDALGLFYADDLAGPWRAHPGNPVIIDARSARPAGMMVQRNALLLRPAQNCTGGYGAGLSLCVVEKLDSENFAQKLIGSLPPPTGLRATAAHTLNASQSVEIIDFFSALPKVMQ